LTDAALIGSRGSAKPPFGDACKLNFSAVGRSLSNFDDLSFGVMAAQLIVELYVNPASRNMRSLNERINRLQERAPRAESHPGLPTTLGNEGTSRVLLTVWREECGHQMGPTAGMAARWDDETPVPDRREHLAFPRCRSRRMDNRRDRNRPAVARVVARLIVVGGLVLALWACSATRAIDIICPPTGQCPNTSSGHGGGY
jgi:hypothetical protein